MGREEHMGDKNVWWCHSQVLWWAQGGLYIFPFLHFLYFFLWIHVYYLHLNIFEKTKFKPLHNIKRGKKRKMRRKKRGELNELKLHKFKKGISRYLLLHRVKLACGQVRSLTLFTFYFCVCFLSIYGKKWQTFPFMTIKCPFKINTLCKNNKSIFSKLIVSGA